MAAAAWSDAVDYALGAVVTHGGHTYEWSSADNDAAVEPPAGSWVQLDAAPTGATGGTGIQITGGQTGANFPWLLTGGGDVVIGSGSITFLWTPNAGGRVNMVAGLIGAPISDVQITMALQVSNLTGDEGIIVVDQSGVTDASAQGLEEHLMAGEAQVVGQTGTDLSYDTEFGDVVSAAGGIFMVSALVSITND